MGYPRGWIRAAAAIAILCVVAGCASRPQETAAARTLLPMEAIDPNALPETVLTASVENPDDDGVHSVLALSAGGADGAFGAGVLTGWTKSGERPQFDVVTGVSTGALMAVLAFLGPQYDAKLEEFYTTQTNATIFRRRGFDGLLGQSLYDNEPLKKQIESFITDEILAKIAAEYAKGRRLYIATTNLDAGELTIWDMGDIANGGRTDARLHFQKVLRASAAVPGYFEPVYIKPQRGLQLRQAHVDGGVKAPVLVAGFMFPENRKPKELYLVINGSTARQNSGKPVKANLADIAKKSILELMRELQDEQIFRDYVLARNVRAKFHLTAIPDAIGPSQESLDFNIERMRKLFAAGQAEGLKGPKSWQSDPPNTTRFERLAGN